MHEHLSPSGLGLPYFQSFVHHGSKCANAKSSRGTSHVASHQHLPPPQMQRTTVVTGSPWLVAPHLRSHYSYRVFIFPSSGGGGNTFFPWCNAAPNEVEVLCVQYPGRGTRFSETPLKTITAYVDALLQDSGFVKSMNSKPFVFLGT